MILVDSTVWIDYFRGIETPQVEKLDALLGKEEIAIGDLVLVEVLQGFDDERDFRQAERALAALDRIDLGGHDLALKAAQNFRALRKRGVTVRKTIDTVIATRCIEDGHILLHNDRDFEPFVAHLGLRSVM